MKKILLLHGWNYSNYSNLHSEDLIKPWDNKKEFIANLKECGFKVIAPSFPGFFGYTDKEPLKPWKLDDYVSYCSELVKLYKPDIVLGYSFGGSVAALWKVKFNNNGVIKIVLVAPSLERAYKKRLPLIFSLIKKMIPTSINRFFRHIYIKYVLRNQFYLLGSRFTRESYLNIVRENRAEELLKIKNPKKILMIFGSLDTATPFELALPFISKKPDLLDRVSLINGAGHDLLKTHNQTVTSLVKNFCDETND